MTLSFTYWWCVRLTWFGRERRKGQKWKPCNELIIVRCVGCGDDTKPIRFSVKRPKRKGRKEPKRALISFETPNIFSSKKISRVGINNLIASMEHESTSVKNSFQKEHVPWQTTFTFVDGAEERWDALRQKNEVNLKVERRPTLAATV